MNNLTADKIAYSTAFGMSFFNVLSFVNGERERLNTQLKTWRAVGDESVRYCDFQDTVEDALLVYMLRFADGLKGVDEDYLKLRYNLDAKFGERSVTLNVRSVGGQLDYRVVDAEQGACPIADLATVSDWYSKDRITHFWAD